MTEAGEGRRARWMPARRWVLRAALACAALLAAERALGWCFPYPLDRLRGLPVSTVVTAADGTWLRVTPTAAGERVLPLRWGDASPMLRSAVLASEDRRFFEHGGVDVVAALRAAASNLAAGRVVSGASTLTMQVVRIVEPRPRTLWAKVVEAFRARQLERLLDKEQIASVWLTHVPMGGTLRGLEAAARYWFDVPATQLDAAAAAALVAMVPAPSARAPDRHPLRLSWWRGVVLQRMVAQGSVESEVAAGAALAPLGMRRHGWPWRMQHLCDGELRAGGSPAVTGAAPVLVTAADCELQARVEQVVDAARDAPGDGLAVVVVDLVDGRVRALVGDRDARAPLDLSRRRRCAGSTLKPFLYALAHEHGALAPGALLDDSPLAFADWQPANFDRGHAGRLRPADALATSNNLVAVRCLQRTGVDAFADLLLRLGVESARAELHHDVALGTCVVSPRELASAYRRFVAEPESLGLSRRSVGFTLAAMRRLSPVSGSGRPGGLSWKSGTSSGRRDAWSVGVTERAVVVVWLGNRDGRGLADLTGVRAANRLLADVAAVL